MTTPDDRPLRDALHAMVERDGRAAPAFAAVVAGRPRVRRVRWLRVGALATAVGAAVVAAVVLRPAAPAAPVAVAPDERDPVLASATSSFLLHDTPDFTSSFALARRMASYTREGR